MKIWKKGRKWSYLAWVRIYWSRDNCLSRYHGWSCVGREVSGVRDAEFLSVFIPSSVCGWSGEWVERGGEGWGGCEGWRGCHRWPGGGGGLECGGAGCDRKCGNGTSAEVKLRILNSWPQIGIGAPDDLLTDEPKLHFCLGFRFRIWSWLWNSTLHSCCECNLTLVAKHCPCFGGNTNQFAQFVQLPVSGLFDPPTLTNVGYVEARDKFSAKLTSGLQARAQQKPRIWAAWCSLG